MSGPAPRGPGRAASISVLVVLLAAAVLAGFAAATARPGDPRLYPPAPCAPQVALFLSRNAYHAELALPAGWLRTRGGLAADALGSLPREPWVLVGWGEARFYRQGGWSVERIRDGLRALWPTNPSVIRLTPLDREPDLAFRRGVLRIELSEPGAEKLVQRLDRSFRPVGGRPVRVPALQPGDDAAYFQSVERFSLAKTCNTWIGQMLNAAGLSTTPVLEVAPQSLFWEARLRADGVSGPAACAAPGRRSADGWRSGLASSG